MWGDAENVAPDAGSFLAFRLSEERLVLGDVWLSHDIPMPALLNIEQTLGYRPSEVLKGFHAGFQSSVESTKLAPVRRDEEWRPWVWWKMDVFFFPVFHEHKLRDIHILVIIAKLCVTITIARWKIVVVNNISVIFRYCCFSFLPSICFMEVCQHVDFSNMEEQTTESTLYCIVVLPWGRTSKIYVNITNQWCVEHREQRNRNW